jgi:carbamoyltransferase
VPDPFMVQVYPVRPDKRDVIPAVTHVDGSGRLQTVSRDANRRYWLLIKAFEKLTGPPHPSPPPPRGEGWGGGVPQAHGVL